MLLIKTKLLMNIWQCMSLLKSHYSSFRPKSYCCCPHSVSPIAMASIPPRTKGWDRSKKKDMASVCLVELHAGRRKRLGKSFQAMSTYLWSTSKSGQSPWSLYDGPEQNNLTMSNRSLSMGKHSNKIKVEDMAALWLKNETMWPKIWHSSDRHLTYSTC